MGEQPTPIDEAHMRPEFAGATSASGMDDGLIAVRGMDSVALAFITIPSIREHQATIVQERLIGLAERSKGRVAVSMSDVGDMSSAGINAMVAINNRCTELGGRLALFGLSREIRKMFKVTKLDRAIVIAETAHEAVRSFDETPRKSFWKQAFTWAKHERDAA
jgi:anti-sigma B factor antagonist